MSRFASRSEGSTSGKRSPSRRAVLYSGLAVIAVALIARAWWGAAEADAQNPAKRKPAKPKPEAGATASDAPQSEAPPAQAPEPPKFAAIVNGEEIGRQELAKQCVRLYGEEVLLNLVNKRVISQECKARNISIDPAEVDKEIDRLAARFGLSTDRWLSMLEQERGIPRAQYMADIVWPTLALRTLASAKLDPTDAELKAAHAAKYGAAVQVRLIACNSQEKAERVHEQAVADPKRFSRLAKEHSDDPNSASSGGMVQPIRRGMGNDELEQVAFALEPGQVSDIVRIGNQFVLLKCEKQLPPLPVTLAKAREELTQEIRDRKERQAAAEVFQQLQEKAAIENVLNDPVKSKQYPGVAAIVSGHKITLLKLGEECIARHGKDVLEGLILRRLIQQACQDQGVKVTDADLDEEMLRAAESAGVDGADQQQVLDKWIDMVTQEQGVTFDAYLDDIVWPSVALKHLVGDAIEISEQDLKKGFEANYGPRAKCLAIVLNSQRRAQEVWELARDNPTDEYFGDLAEQYSVDATSAQLRGQVAPIQQHGGQPTLEQAAFDMEPGEMSGIVQAGEQFVILRLVSFTKPVEVEFDEVRDLIYEDLHEKKLRLAMATRLDEIKQSAQIDNYIAGTVQEGQRPASATTDEAQPRTRTATPGGATRR